MSAAPNSCPSNYTFHSRIASIISLGARVISCAWPQLVASLPKAFGLRPMRLPIGASTWVRLNTCNEKLPQGLRFVAAESKDRVVSPFSRVMVAWLI